MVQEMKKKDLLKVTKLTNKETKRTRQGKWDAINES